MIDWKGYEKRRKASEKNGRLRGRSVCYYIEFGGIFNDRMDIRFDPGGTVTIFGGTHSHGQGPRDRVCAMRARMARRAVRADPLRAGGHRAGAVRARHLRARSAVVGGSALKRAADAVIEKAKPMAAAMMEADAGDIEFSDGASRWPAPTRRSRSPKVAKASYAPMGPMTKFGIGLEGSGSHSPEPPSHPNGAHAVEVEIDPETGEVTVDRYVMVDDLGQVLNPMIVNGQQHGGVAQGIGQALYEHAVYDRQSAQLVTGSFMDYVMPRADMLPNFEIALEEVPCKTNPIGVKGIGESGTIGAPPVVINALIDALSPLGIDRIDMPATPSRVWAAIQAARAA
jgi:carbon-monoxide dehydrogenase large subunit